MNNSYRIGKIIVFCLISIVLVSCYYSYPNQIDHWRPIKGQGIDSVNFKIGHHYWRGYNLQVQDSIKIICKQPESSFSTTPTLSRTSISGFQDTLVLKRGTKIVVTDIAYGDSLTKDSVWVRVASDQLTQGWIGESTMLEKCVPDDPISIFIHNFSQARTLVFISFFVCFLLLTGAFILLRHHRHKLVIPFILKSSGLMVRSYEELTFYPILLGMVISTTALTYGTIQKFAPQTWVEYYFNPTLNPFSPELPLILSLFVGMIWLLTITTLSVVTDFFKNKTAGTALLSLGVMACECILLYLIFTLSVNIYIGYLLYPLYCVGVLRQYVKNFRLNAYLCGHCNQPLKGAKKCPHCGAYNQ